MLFRSTIASHNSPVPTVIPINTVITVVARSFACSFFSDFGILLGLLMYLYEKNVSIVNTLNKVYINS